MLEKIKKQVKKILKCIQDFFNFDFKEFQQISLQLSQVQNNLEFRFFLKCLFIL
jgi:hypothetical protein